MTKKVKTDAWMPLWIGDYLADTTGLSDALHGNYLLILMAYWRNKGPLIDDDTLRSTAKCEESAWSTRRAVLMRYFEVDNGMWRHQRADDEIANATKRSLAAQAKASKGGKARKAKIDAKNSASGTASGSAPSTQQAPVKQCLESAPSPSPVTLLSTMESKGGEGAAAPPPPALNAPSPPPPAPAAPPPVDKPVKKSKAKKPPAEASGADRRQWTKTESYPEAPEWLPWPEWHAFIEMRKRTRTWGVFTDGARDLTLKKLEAMREKHDPAELLSTAVQRGWRSVYEPFDRTPGDQQAANPELAEELRRRRRDAEIEARKRVQDEAKVSATKPPLELVRRLKEARPEGQAPGYRAQKAAIAEDRAKRAGKEST